MYNFNFLEDEKLIRLFDEVLIKKDNKEIITTIALTNKRLLFLDYITNDGYEVLKITKGVNFIKYKDVYYQIDLNNIESIEYNDEYYLIVLKDKTSFQFNNIMLYELLKNMYLR